MGLQAAAAQGLEATWQRCRWQVMRNALAPVHKTQRGMVSATIAKVSTAPTRWRG